MGGDVALSPQGERADRMGGLEVATIGRLECLSTQDVVCVYARYGLCQVVPSVVRLLPVGRSPFVAHQMNRSRSNYPDERVTVANCHAPPPSLHPPRDIEGRAL